MLVDIHELPNAQTDVVVRVRIASPRPFPITARWLEVVVPQVYGQPHQYVKPQTTRIEMTGTDTYDVTVRFDGALSSVLADLAGLATEKDPDAVLIERVRATYDETDLLVSEAAAGDAGSWTGRRSDR